MIRHVKSSCIVVLFNTIFFVLNYQSNTRKPTQLKKNTKREHREGCQSVPEVNTGITTHQLGLSFRYLFMSCHLQIKTN